MPTVYSWMVLGLVLLLPGVGLAGSKKTFFEDNQAGTLIAVDATGHFKPVTRASVQLTCIGPAEACEHFNRSCDSLLVVKRDGKAVARAENGLMGVNYDMVAGNEGGVTLSLLSVGGGASLIVLRAKESEGDEEMRESADDQVFVIVGSTRREVYRFESMHSVDLGPDGDMSQLSAAERRYHARLVVDRARTLEVPNLIVQEQIGNSRSWRAQTVLTWNGKTYVACTNCQIVKGAAVVPPQPATAAPPTTAPPATAAPADPYHGIIPLLGQIYRGERLTTDAIFLLSDYSLSILRNAPYARHGRRFKSPHLTQIFYATHRSPLPELQINPSFQESMLDDSDRANVATVLAELRRRKDSSAPKN